MRLLTALRNRWDKMLRKNGDQLPIFLVCLFIATFFWLLNALSKTYITQIDYPIVYQNISEDWLVVNKPEKTIAMEIESYGFNLLAQQLKSKTSELQLDAENFLYKEKPDGKLGYLSNRLLFEKISDLLSSEIKVNRVLSDSIFLSLEPKAEKKLGIALQANIQMSKGFAIAGNPIFEPESIWVVGPARLLSQLSAIPTETANLINIQKGWQGTLKLATIDLLSYSEQEVSTTIPVEPITQIELQIPIVLDNPEIGERVKLFPTHTKVVLSAPVHIAQQLLDDSLVAQCLSIGILRDERSLRLRLPAMPKEVKVLNFTPKRVQYLLLK